jgi:16S rRNA (guanine1207-N2)-methyltransferase
MDPQDYTFTADLRGHKLKFVTTSGLFSSRQIDSGTQLLLPQIKVQPTDTSLDVGCGYGPIGLTLAKLCPEGQIHLVDKDFVAVEYAQRNAELNYLTNCHIYLSNTYSHIPEGVQFDNIITNIPGNLGNDTLKAFIAGAYPHLKPGGQLYVVCMIRLKDTVKRTMTEAFGSYKKLTNSATHYVALATKR